MNRYLLGAVSAIVLLATGLFLWQIRSESSPPTVAPDPPERAAAIPAPPQADAPKFGPAPPEPPQAKQATREERRFNRYDRNRDDGVSRVEMMSTRTSAFKKLDKDANNLLTFEEWAVASSTKFAGADRDKSGVLTRPEFATTAPKRSVARCAC